MLGVIGCRGAPRDLGFAEGSARAREVAEFVSRHVPGPLAEQVERDVWRHFPHLAERCAGLARGARVSRRALVRALEVELGLRSPAPSDGIALGMAAERTPSGPRLLRVLPEKLRLRRSHPDSGFASLEASLPGLPGALAGVNEAGLAACVRTLPLADPKPGSCAAPAFLLVQHCLQHFDAVEKAVDWCLRRPGGGRAALLFGDVGGQAGVLLEPGRRTHLHPVDGLLLASDPAGTPLEKDLAATRVLEGPALRRILGEGPGVPVWCDPASRSLGLLEGPAVAPGPDGVRYLPLR